MSIDKNLLSKLYGGIGFLLLIAILLFTTLQADAKKRVAEEETLAEISSMRIGFTKSIEACLTDITRKTVNEVGLDDESAFMDEVGQKFRDECKHVYSDLDTDMDIEIGEPIITSDIELMKQVSVYVYLPVTFSKEGFSEEAKSFRYNMKLERSVTLSLDSQSRVRDEQRILSDDGESALIFPPGTKVTYDGLTIDNVQQMIVPTKRTNILGHIMYDIKPDGLTFSQPVTLMINYSQEELPDNVQEDMLRIVYCEKDMCEAVPSVVDKVNKVVTATIYHTTPYGIDLSCAIFRICDGVIASNEQGQAIVGPISG